MADFDPRWRGKKWWRGRTRPALARQKVMARPDFDGVARWRVAGWRGGEVGPPSTAPIYRGKNFELSWSPPPPSVNIQFSFGEYARVLELSAKRVERRSAAGEHRTTGAVQGDCGGEPPMSGP